MRPGAAAADVHRVVQFVQEPEERPYGAEAVARDDSGNWTVLVETKDLTRADFA
ncbi:MAG: hypothetical protein QOF00_3398 [Pseudonocardiales bacterium]|nr:hypothetical protein [Pseudonocardiales bacterium]